MKGSTMKKHIPFSCLVLLLTILLMTTAHATSSVINPYSRFAYDGISPEEQLLYRQIDTIIANHKDEGRLSAPNASSDNVYNALIALVNDKPEYFYFDWYSLASLPEDTLSEMNVFRFHAKYLMDKATASKKQKQIERVVADLRTQTMNASDYEKALAVYRYIIINTDYQKDLHNSAAIDGILIDHRGQCAGYARTTQYLLNRLGVEAGYIAGEILSIRESHAWNMVKLDDIYYHVDTTWGDPVYTSAKQTKYQSINYDYFALNDADMLRDRNVDKRYIHLPEANGTKHYFAKMEGYYLTEYSIEKVMHLLEKAYKEKNFDSTIVPLIFDTPELCEQAYNALFENDDVYTIIHMLQRDGKIDVDIKDVRYHKENEKLSIYLRPAPTNQNITYLDSYAIDKIMPYFISSYFEGDVIETSYGEMTVISLFFTSPKVCNQAYDALHDNRDADKIVQTLVRDNIINVNTEDIRYAKGILQVRIYLQPTKENQDTKYLNAYSIDQVYPLLKQSYQRNEPFATLRFQTPELCQQATNTLFEKGEIFDITERLFNDGIATSPNTKTSYFANYLHLNVYWK